MMEVIQNLPVFICFSPCVHKQCVYNIPLLNPLNVEDSLCAPIKYGISNRIGSLGCVRYHSNYYFIHYLTVSLGNTQKSALHAISSEHSRFVFSLAMHVMYLYSSIVCPHIGLNIHSSNLLLCLTDRSFFFVLYFHLKPFRGNIHPDLHIVWNHVFLEIL